MIRIGWKKNKPQSDTADVQAVRAGIGGRSIVLVGLMGCGKSSIGRRLAARLELPFIDADDEIEQAAGRTIPDIFAVRGEAYFREGERKVIQRLV
jgi:shikimate kinase